MAFFRSFQRYSEILVVLFAVSIVREGVALNLRDLDAAQSSLFQASISADKAVDGDVTTSIRTGTTESVKWWRVDLGAFYCLEKITIVNRNDSDAYLLAGANVRAGLSPTYSYNTRIGNAVTAEQASVWGDELHFVANPPVTARYVTVHKSSSTALSFNEIMIQEVTNPTNSHSVSDLTLVANPALLGSFGDNDAVIAAYKGPSDIAAGVSLGRQLTTGGTNADLRLGSVLAFEPPTGCATGILYRFPESDGIDRTGVFYAEARESGTTTRIQAVILPNDAYSPRIRPLQQTKTVNVGDSVTIKMQDLTSSNDNYRWSRNNVAIISWDNQLTGTIASVAEADGGIYSCFVDGQENQQKHGFMRLIVRACPAGMWGPAPSCQNTCRRCYNGGICDDKTGACICAPGFSGDSCQLFHGRNVFGQNADHSCSGGTDQHNPACRGRLFCLPDPYGCSCAAGYTGLDCTQECPQGKYGADCKQTCHCASGVTCLRDTGKCNGDNCAAQHFGGNCQCSEQNQVLSLRLASDVPNQLTADWQPDPCITGYTLEYALTNRGQCGSIKNPQRVSVTLSDSLTVTISGLEYQSTYTVYIRALYNTVQGPEFSVSVVTMSKTNSTSVTPLEETAKDSTSISLSWQEVFCANYKVEYVLYNRDGCDPINPLPDFTEHCLCTDVTTVISSLHPHSQYIVRVQALVDGSSGPRETLNIDTSMTAPTGPPTEIEVTRIEQRKLTFSWSEPACGTRGGTIVGYNYKLTTSRPLLVVKESTTTQTSIRIADLIPYKEYLFEISANTSVRPGPVGQANITRTAEAEPTVPLNIQVQNLDDESVTLVWAEPNPPQGIILHYNIRYDLMPPTDGSTVVQDVTGLTYRVGNLQTRITYFIQVQAETVVGSGPWSDSLQVFTQVAAPIGPPAEIEVTRIEQRKLTFSWSEPACSTRGGCVVGYNYKLVPISPTSPLQVIKESITTQRILVIRDLIPYTEYRFEISAYTSVGLGPVGQANITRTAEAEPTVPLNIQVQNLDDESVTLVWTKPNPPQGIILHYNIRYDLMPPTDGSTVVQDVTGLTYRVGNLQTRITYFIQVQAETVVGSGPWSDSLQVFTQVGVPGNVRNLRATIVTDRLISLEWEAPVNPNGQITGYIVEYRILEKPYETNFEMGNLFLKMEVTASRYQGDAFEPGTKYELKVSARNQLQTGLQSVVEVYTKPLNDDDIPQPAAVNVFSEETTDTTVTIGLAEVVSKYIISYIIKVERELSKKKREAFIPRHHRDSADDYIAAEIPKADVTQRFVVGDSTAHGGYYNAPLQTGDTYRIRVGALSRGNGSEANVKYSEPVAVSVQKPSGNSIGLVVGIVVVLMGVLVVAIVGWVLWRKRNARKPTTHNLESTVEGMGMSARNVDKVQEIESSHGDVSQDDCVYENVGLPAWVMKLEIKWGDVRIEDKVLGKGNFGEVRAGKVKIKGRFIKAAIKTLKAGAKTSTKDDFMAEFQTMTKIKKHPNIVCLLGACHYEDILYVALEFLPNGNLRDYLRKIRPSQDTDQTSGQDAGTSSLTSSNLLTFGIDVARGMQHLSNTGIIHRDLAARNILLAEDLTAKVSDFGLSRSEDIYVRNSSTRIPVRWLAIESLVNREYESKSDVWSFGILLWEIATFGSTPYPGIESRSLAQKLRDGYRMPKPENCADEMYGLMTRCWQEQWNDRPSFKELYAALEKMNDPDDKSIYVAPVVCMNCIIKPEFDDN